MLRLGRPSVRGLHGSASPVAWTGRQVFALDRLVSRQIWRCLLGWSILESQVQHMESQAAQGVRVRRPVGRPLPGNRATVGERLWPSSCLSSSTTSKSARSSAHERYRVDQRLLPPGGQGPRALPDRGRGVEVSVASCHQVARPDRRRQSPLDSAVEGTTQRLRDHLRRTLRAHESLNLPGPHTVYRTVPTSTGCGSPSLGQPALDVVGFGEAEVRI
jgi:hypothetical protein